MNSIVLFRGNFENIANSIILYDQIIFKLNGEIQAKQYQMNLQWKYF